VVTVLLPDNTVWNLEIDALAKKLAEAGKTREKMEQTVALASEKPEVKRYLDLTRKVEAKEVALNAEQETAWLAMKARFAAVKRQLDLLGGEIRGLIERERLYVEQAAALEAAKAQASARPSCTLGAVTGDTVVRTMKVVPGGFPLGDLPAKEMHKRLRAHGNVQDKLFGDSSGSFSWSGQNPGV